MLSALGMARGEVDELHTAMRTVHGELADTDYTTLEVVLQEPPSGPAPVTRADQADADQADAARVTGMLSRATAGRLPRAIRFVRDRLGALELSHRTGSDPTRLSDLADRFQNAGSSR